ncbi:MAG TPA: cyclic nucleotide-binding domain-containing protein [Vicinamibacteria bacterium]
MISPELLRRHAFFADLSAAELEALATVGAEQLLAAGEMLFTEGGRADQFYFLAEGEMETLLKTDDEDISLSAIPPGEPVGWSALIEPHVYTASARATRPSKVIAFPRATLAALLEDDHVAATLMKKLAELISRRLRDTQVQLLSLTARQHT